jgi:hypothetical protein
MSDHHQHGALIARPPKDRSTFHGNIPDRREGAPAAGKQAAPPRPSLLGRFLDGLFPKARH